LIPNHLAGHGYKKGYKLISILIGQHKVGCSTQALLLGHKANLHAKSNTFKRALKKSLKPRIAAFGLEEDRRHDL
jgi:hypothetical protein